MEEFSIINERIKNSIHAFLEDTSNSSINEFDLKFFKPICADCARRDCTIQHALLNANMISSCKYFTRTAAASDTKAVGGTIFYIDDTADGEYQFFDVDGNLIENVQVGDRPYAYKVVSSGSKDKYYVYYDKLYEGLWTYRKSDDYVLESLGISNNAGSGKTNTEVVMAKDNGAYIAEDPDWHPTIWYQLQQARLAKVGGCDDWFVPSKYEIDELRLAIESGNITGGIIAGSLYNNSVFTYKWLWSSSGYSSQYAWSWGSNGQYWYGSFKGSNFPVFFARAF